MTDFRLGRLTAQNTDIGPLLRSIQSTIESNKGLSDFERGVLFEISNNQISKLGTTDRKLLNLCLKVSGIKNWDDSVVVG